MYRLRAAILCNAGEETNPYVLELRRRGYPVEFYLNSHSLLGAMRTNPDEVRLVVLDHPGADQEMLVKQLLLATRYNVPQVFWLTEPECGPNNPNDFEHELMGPRNAIKVLLRGDLKTFGRRLDFLESWLARHELPTLTIQHSRRALLLHQLDSKSYKEWIARYDCDPLESIADILLQGFSLHQVGKTLTDPIRPSDLYWLDRLARAQYPMTMEVLARSMTDQGSYVFASRLERNAPNGYSVSTGKNVLKRIRGGFTLLGVDGHAVVPYVDGRYFIDRSRIRIDVEHLKE